MSGVQSGLHKLSMGSSGLKGQEKRRRGTRWSDDTMEVDDDDIPNDESDEREDDGDNTAEVLTMTSW